MIRRDEGDQFCLISQHDHALLSGKLAERIGNSAFATPIPLEPVRLAISLHDSGWPLHDESPTINPQGKPLHVFETPPEVAMRVWPMSAERAAEADPYAGLLVSLHVMTLSQTALDMAAGQGRRFTAAEMFAFNRFQHAEIERQESLRARLGLRVDLPTQFGLVAAGLDESEDQLRANFRLLRGMDLLSLDLCCTDEFFPAMHGLVPRSGVPATTIQIERHSPGELTLRPWPFEADEYEFGIPCKRISARRYADDGDLRAAMACVGEQSLQLRIQRRAAGGPSPSF